MGENQSRIRESQGPAVRGDKPSHDLAALPNPFCAIATAPWVIYTNAWNAAESTKTMAAQSTTSPTGVHLRLLRHTSGLVPWFRTVGVHTPGIDLALFAQRCRVVIEVVYDRHGHPVSLLPAKRTRRGDDVLMHQPPTLRGPNPRINTRPFNPANIQRVETPRGDDQPQLSHIT